MLQYQGGNSFSGKPFPGGTELNHVSASEMGPLKSDWTKACPQGSHAERKEKCVSVQEAVWGTENLEKLLRIKSRIDPEYIFQCVHCVGFQGFHAPEGDR